MTLGIVSTNDKATITLTYVGPYGGSASDSFTFALTNDTTVVPWVDGTKVPVDFPPTDSLGNPAEVVQNLMMNGPLQCGGTLLQWEALGKQGIGIGDHYLTSAERLFANEFLIDGSANPPPPQQMPVDQRSFVTNQQYRLYQRFQAYYELTSSGAIRTPPVILQTSVEAGVSPEPCSGLQVSILSRPAETGPLNGQFGITSDGTTIYQISEARLGDEGQQINQFLNGPSGANYITTTPWIWSVVQFDSSGRTTAWRQGSISDNLAIFPTYQVYTNGFALPPTIQPDIMTFIGLTSAFQYKGPQ